MSNDERHARFMQRALDEAARRCCEGHGGPFAALVVKDDVVIATGWNQVTSLNDPTAHAEVQAIRAACAACKSFQLTGCDVYTTCEPCPMCLGALYWARPRAVYFAATRADAAAAGFDDAFIYDELARPLDNRAIPTVSIALATRCHPFEVWTSLQTRVRY